MTTRPTTLPGQIPPQNAPLSYLDANGQQITDINWYLFLYRLWKEVVSSTGANALLLAQDALLMDPVSGGGTSSLAPIADKTILANISGASAVPIGNTLTALFDAILGSTQGQLITRNATGWTVISPGAATTVLTSNGPAANLSFAAVAAGGLINWVEAQSNVFPNDVRFVDSFTALSTTAHADAAIIPKGQGAFILSNSNSLTGGNKRGISAVDLQTANGRTSALQIATSDFSVIGGGSTNKISAVNGNNSVIAGGLGNGITAITGAVACTVSGGESNLISSNGNDNTICGGTSNTISSAAFYSTILGGFLNSIGGSALYRTAMGGQSLARNCDGAVAHAAGIFANNGDAQYSRYVLRTTTTTVTTRSLNATGATATSTNQPPLSFGSSMTFLIRVSARDTTTNDTAGWSVQGAIVNNGGTVSLVGTPTVTTWANAGAAAWTLAVVADNVNKCLQINGTGAAVTTIQWVATVETCDNTS